MAKAQTVTVQPGNNRVVHRIGDQDETVTILAVIPGVIKTIMVLCEATFPTYIKLWDKSTTVTPTSDDPDWQIYLTNASLGDPRLFEFDVAVGTFDNGLAISVASTPGLTHTAPSTPIDVTVNYDES